MTPVLESAVVVRLQQDIYVPLEALDAVTAQGAVLAVPPSAQAPTGTAAADGEQDSTNVGPV